MKSPVTIMDINFYSEAPKLYKLLEVEYNKKDKLDIDELELISKDASEGFSTINGDTAKVEISVRQFILLAQGWFKCNINDIIGERKWAKHCL
jgi:hypothetical protein